MDKKNTTIGVALLLAAFAMIYFGPKPTPPIPAVTPVPSAAPDGSTTTSSTTPGATANPAAPFTNTAFAAVNR
ncbi:MAG: hypothetical protein ABIQ12_13665, partial [Opitutaceae bacterium]